MLPGANMKNVFASRWKALYWALGVMVTAYCTIPAAEPDSGSATPAQTKIADATPHKGKKDPWAKGGAAHDYVKSSKGGSSLAAGYFDDKAVEIRERIH